MGMISEFKDFAMKGNLVDMAVGVVMGAAFGSVSKAFIEGMFMPLVGSIFQVGNFNDMELVLSAAVMEGDKVVTPESAIAYGSFIGAVINFLIVAFVMFMVIKGINAMKKAEEAKPAPAPGPTADQALLMEIRDALKK
jgi:large conductance mechanosensitive channel